MKYKKQLAKIIKDSNLSLRDIASRCQSLGVPLSHSYISQLQSGKLPAPSEEITIAICNVCNTDPADLILQGYIEKAPDIVQAYFEDCSKVNLKLAKMLHEIQPNTIDEIDFEQMTILKVLDYTISKGWKEYIQYNKTDQISIHNKSYEHIGKNKHEILFMNDKSMEPLIPKNALLEVKEFSTFYNKENVIEMVKPNNNDIVVFRYDGKENIVRRYQKTNDTILLKPENNKYDIIQISNSTDIYIYYKVISYKASVN